VISELDISEKRVPQDGRFKLRIKGRTVDFRVSIMPSVHGEDCVIRILDKESTHREFASLSLDVCGFEDRDMQRMRRFIKEPYGMVLVTSDRLEQDDDALRRDLGDQERRGQDHHDRGPGRVPASGITQTREREEGLTFAAASAPSCGTTRTRSWSARSADAETGTQIAIQSALTGHLVFTTVHANNVVDVLGRSSTWASRPYNFVSALNCILAQRLVRLICSNCKRTVKATRGTRRVASTPAATSTSSSTREGCIDCNGTGYRAHRDRRAPDMSDRIAR
jgi:type IV pilus assembly protein PilB